MASYRLFQALMLCWLAYPLPGYSLFAQSMAEQVVLRRDPLMTWHHGTLVKIKQPADWEERRKGILSAMEEVMGPFPTDVPRVTPTMRKLGEPLLVSKHIRQKISFQVSPKSTVPAWLLIPMEKTDKGLSSERMPALLCLHQTIGIGKDEPVGLGESLSKRQAYDLADLGYVCLVPDYPSFGEYPCKFDDPSWQSGTMLAIWNNSRALDLLGSLPMVDSSRMGAIGHSLGGHNALFTAAFDPRLQVVVSSCGFTSFLRYKGGDLKGWTSQRYMPRIASIYGANPAKMPFDFPEVLAAISPRGMFISAPTQDDNFNLDGVRESVFGAGSVYHLLGAPLKLQLLVPDGGHDFQLESREASYAFIGQNLGQKKSGSGK